MKALILAADGFEDSELLCPRYRLLEEEIAVYVAGPEVGPLTGKHTCRPSAARSCGH